MRFYTDSHVVSATVSAFLLGCGYHGSRLEVLHHLPVGMLS